MMFLKIGWSELSKLFNNKSTVYYKNIILLILRGSRGWCVFNRNLFILLLL
jgi:hypothetical protein